MLKRLSTSASRRTLWNVNDAQPCCMFQTITGEKIASASATPPHAHGEISTRRDFASISTKTSAAIGTSAIVYFDIIPRPIAMPAGSHAPSSSRAAPGAGNTRRGPRRGERCVRRDDHADDEEVGQRAGEQRGAKRRGSSAEVARVERDEDDHHDPARHRGEANEELAGAKLRNRGDQPGDERRVIDVADVGMLRIIPVVSFLRDQLDLSEIDQAQRHEIRDAECDGAAQARLARAFPAGVIAQKQRGSQARDQHAREGRRNDRRERRPMLLNGEQGEDARAQDIREHEHHQHVAIRIHGRAP